MTFCIKFDRQELFYEYEAHTVQKQSIELNMHSQRLRADTVGPFMVRNWCFVFSYPLELKYHILNHLFNLKISL